MEPVKGVDISEFNGDVDMDVLKENSVEFVMIRLGYGSDLESQDDKYYTQNIKKCEEAGMPYGVYLYSYANSRAEVESEVSHTLRLIDSRKPSYGVWYDIEDSTLPTGTVLVDNCEHYCRLIEQAGYYCGIYASLYYWQNKLNDSRLDAFDKWVAHWADEIGYDGAYGIWQYSNRGVIGGKRFDLNLAYKDYPAIIEGDETDMTREEVAALARSEAQKVYDENEGKYKTIGDTPKWAREDILKLYEYLQLEGTSGAKGEKTEIDGSDTYVRALKVISELVKKLEDTGVIEG